MKKGNPFIVFSIFSLLLSTMLILSGEIAQAQSSQYKISGYILDSNGKGIVGAEVIFNVPTIIHSVFTDNSGCYETYGPSGTYHMNVWPPFDSNYISYDEPGVVISLDLTKNVTMYTGYKVSGIISDISGAPMVGACVFLNGNGSGWFSTSTGYYFVAVPAGNYTI